MYEGLIKDVFGAWVNSWFQRNTPLFIAPKKWQAMEVKINLFPMIQLGVFRLLLAGVLFIWLKATVSWHWRWLGGSDFKPFIDSLSFFKLA